MTITLPFKKNYNYAAIFIISFKSLITNVFLFLRLLNCFRIEFTEKGSTWRAEMERR